MSSVRVASRTCFTIRARFSGAQEAEAESSRGRIHHNNKLYRR
jgi:hypothetical protein